MIHISLEDWLCGCHIISGNGYGFIWVVYLEPGSHEKKLLFFPPFVNMGKVLVLNILSQHKGVFNLLSILFFFDRVIETAPDSFFLC